MRLLYLLLFGQFLKFLMLNQVEYKILPPGIRDLLHFIQSTHTYYTKRVTFGTNSGNFCCLAMF